jgi:phage terminase large subunit GpA-like protein
LTAEIWDSTKRRWVKIRPRNEALDCYGYAMAAAMQPALRLHTWREAQWAKFDQPTADLFSTSVERPAPPRAEPQAPEPRQPAPAARSSVLSRTRVSR